AKTPALANTFTNVQFAPFEATDVPFIKQMIADMGKYEPSTHLGIPTMVGYIAADMFISALKAVGKDLTVDSFLKTLNSGSFTYGGEGYVGVSKWPFNHVAGVPCGSLVGLKNSAYYVAAP